MKQRTKLKKAISIIILFLMIFNFIDLIIGKSSVFAANTDGLTQIPKFDNSSQSDGLYDDGKLYKVDGKVYSIYYENGKAYGLEYKRTTGDLTTEDEYYDPTNEDKAKELNIEIINFHL